MRRKNNETGVKLRRTTIKIQSLSSLFYFPFTPQILENIMLYMQFRRVCYINFTTEINLFQLKLFREQLQFLVKFILAK